MAGASTYFRGGVVAYHNEVKEQLLGVKPESLAAHGAVSEQVVREMAEGARLRLGADYALSTSGIAGPSGGSDEKPVGTVWMAVATPQGTLTACRQCGTDRGQIIHRATATVIRMLWQELNR
jgi:nicotinamide-nucleotide amidase